MSTRALYTFHDADASWNVYKHHDGYPSGAAAILRDAIDVFAWELPRFEADEFACSFIAAAKAQALIGFAMGNREEMTDYLPGGMYHRYRGGVARLMPQGPPERVAQQSCADIEYRYELMMGTGGKKLIIKALTSNGGERERVIFYGPFHDFEQVATKLNTVNENYSIYETAKRKRRKPLAPHVSTGRPA